MPVAPRKYTLGKRAESVAGTRQRIIDATFDLHTEKGVVATSMQDVAERADVALRTVYNHYPTIDDLVAGCTVKVIVLLAPPTPAIFNGLATLEERVLRLVSELFAMYERGAPQLAVARREQDEVAGLAAYVANERAQRQALVAEALRGFDVTRCAYDEVSAMTDYYVWRAFADQGLDTHQAVEAVVRSLMELVKPGAAGQKERGNMKKPHRKEGNR